jgi:hypothetical protein
VTRALVILALVAATACGDVLLVVPTGMQGLNPPVADPVPLPVQLMWTEPDAATQAQIDDGERYYVIFVDRPPIAPGASLGSLVSGDCERETGCPDHAWFADIGVYVTQEPQLFLTRLADLRTSERAGAPDRHMATVVIADDKGVRLDEVAASIPFVVDREGADG